MRKRSATTLLELLVAISIILILLAILGAAAQRVRDAAARMKCQNNLRQIALALHQFHNSNSRLPEGMTFDLSKSTYRYLAWSARILPYLERSDIWTQVDPAYQVELDFRRPPHPVGIVLSVYMCPSDPRYGAAATNGPWQVGLTSYLGNEGINQLVTGGVLFVNSRVSFESITDGLSNTLLVGERPPSSDSLLGWWYAGSGQKDNGSGDSVLGARELFDAMYHSGCQPGPYHFVDGRLTEECDFLHFWSVHPGGAHFAFCDGSVRFLAYSADSVLPGLATRAGGESVQIPD